MVATSRYGSTRTCRRHTYGTGILHRRQRYGAGEPDDPAAAVLFLTSPGGSHITGQLINVDGAWAATMRSPRIQSTAQQRLACPDARGLITQPAELRAAVVELCRIGTVEVGRCLSDPYPR
jgi:hypothetical protein